MATTQPERLEQLQGQARQAFEKANPAIWKTIQGQPEKIEKVKNIQDRVQHITHRLNAHAEKHREVWVAREAVKLLEEDGRVVLEHPRPNWARDLPGHLSVLQEARNRVQSRIEGRMTRLAQAGQHMEARIASNQVPERNHGPRDPALRREVQAIINRIQIMRDKARAHYAKHRDAWLVNAARRDSENPKMDVWHRQQARMRRIDRAGDYLIHELFADRHRSLPATRDTTLVQRFTQVRE